MDIRNKNQDVKKIKPLSGNNGFKGKRKGIENSYNHSFHKQDSCQKYFYIIIKSYLFDINALTKPMHPLLIPV